jgi:hypothetical protein
MLINNFFNQKKNIYLHVFDFQFEKHGHFLKQLNVATQFLLYNFPLVLLIRNITEYHAQSYYLKLLMI